MYGVMYEQWKGHRNMNMETTDQCLPFRVWGMKIRWKSKRQLGFCYGSELVSRIIGGEGGGYIWLLQGSIPSLLWEVK